MYKRYRSRRVQSGESSAQRSAEYAAWANMRTRCHNRNRSQWLDYGGRGIEVCWRWKSYAAFLYDMGRMPHPRMTLDRIDNDEHYGPANCRWVTRADNATRTRRVKLVEAFGEIKTHAEWAKDPRCPGLTGNQIYQRLWRGACPEKAITSPLNRNPRVSLRVL